MAKTKCASCLFAGPANSENSCVFNIPSIVKDSKEVNIIDNYYEISKYRCLYGFDKNQYESNKQDLQNMNLQDLVVERAKIKYYLVVNIKDSSTDIIESIIDNINKLDFKPQYISFISDAEDIKSKIIYDLIRKNLECRKWKLHIFVKELPINNCINVALDTCLIESQSWCVCFVNANELPTDGLLEFMNDYIYYLQHVFIITQQNNCGVKYGDKKSLHMLCLNCSVYKFLLSEDPMNKDILNLLEITPQIKLLTYEAK